MTHSHLVTSSTARASSARAISSISSSLTDPPATHVGGFAAGPFLPGVGGFFFCAQPRVALRELS